MKPILFAKNETNFTTNGLGRLDCISCEVVEERNGIYELEAEIPITGAHANELEMHSIIGVIPHEGSNIQAFYVYKIGKPISGRFRVYGRHISYRLTDIPCMPFSVAMSPQAAAQTLAGLKSNAIEACPFNFYTDITTPASYTQKTPASIRQRLGGVEGSVIDLFGGEFEWDNWDVRLLKARGRLANVTGISLRYGKNITDLDQEEEIASTVTGVVPFWIDTDGNNLVTLPEHAVYAPTAGSFPYHLTQVLDLSSDFQDKPTVAQLRNTATLYVNKDGFGVPKVSIKVSFVDLWKSEEYKDIAPLEQVKLCDEITVDFEKLGVKAIAKVVKTTYDVLKERYTQIEVGSIRSTLAQAITDRDKDIDSVYLDVMSKVTQAAQNATAWLTSANGYVVAVKNTDGSWKEILFMDSNDPATARNCLRINNNGLGFWSHDRYPEGSALDGPYDNAWTIDGNLVADYITTGLLKSTNYTAPTIQSAPYAVEGLCLAMNDGTIHSEYFALTDIGAFVKGCIEATSGHIGAATITDRAIKIEGDIVLFSGTGTFTFRPIDYGINSNAIEVAFSVVETYTGTTNVEISAAYDDGSTPPSPQVVGLINNEPNSVDLRTAKEGSSDNYITYTIDVSSRAVKAVLSSEIAYMGVGGFRGVFSGVVNSPQGEIAGASYNPNGFTEGLYFNGIVNGYPAYVYVSPTTVLRRFYDPDVGDYVSESAFDQIDDYQPFIAQEIITPVHTANEGTLVFEGIDGDTRKKLWRREGDQWIEIELGADISYGTDEPTGGEDGDVYIQLSSDLKISYVSADQAWTHERFVYDDSKITGMVISGHGTGGNDIIAYKLTGLIPDAEVTINFTAQITSGSPVYYNRYPNGAYADNVVSTSSRNYVAFTQGTAANNYSLSFTPSDSVAYFWIQLADINDSYTITLDITNLTFQGAVGGSGIKALWVNENGTWQSGYFGGSGGDVFVGATASTAGAKGLVPAPSAGDQNKYLRGDGTWHTVSGGGGGGSYTYTQLFTSTTAIRGDITLSDDISNYDDIELIYGFIGADKTRCSMRFNASYFVDTFKYATVNTSPHALLSQWSSNYVRVTIGQNNNSSALHIWNDNNNDSGVYEVYGINY